jgi:uncharacterized protein (TIGR00730 family)
MRTFGRVCVYGGSSNHTDAKWPAAAAALGHSLATRGIGVVFGGGRVGMMGAMADAALAAGGEVIGVIPEKLQDLELGHMGCTELHVVDSMHSRKRMMADLSDAFIALPGGWGTMEEIMEVTTWTQLNDHLKPVGLLNTEGYWDHLIAWAARACEVGFLRAPHRDMLCADADAGRLLAAMATVEIPRIEEWIASP